MSVPRHVAFRLVMASMGLACGGSTQGTPTADAAAMDVARAGIDGRLDDATVDSPSGDAGLQDADLDAAHRDNGGEVGADAGTDAVSCATYCTEIMAACTGDNAQYEDVASCLNACSYFPPGQPGITSGDSIACRASHAGLAASAPNPNCWNAGPFGYGGCGATYEGFCDIVAALCSANGGFEAGPPPYNSKGDCWLRAAGYPMVNMSTVISPPGMVGLDGGYSAKGPTSGNTFDCRGYYLGQALRGGVSQQLHCNHAGPSSSTCM